MNSLLLRWDQLLRFSLVDLHVFPLQWLGLEQVLYDTHELLAIYLEVFFTKCSSDGVGGRAATSRSAREVAHPPASHTPPVFAHASGLGAVVNFSFSGAAAVGIQRQRQRTGVSALLGVHTTFLLQTLHPSSHTPPAWERW
jgi:hypothetical protein